MVGKLKRPLEVGDAVQPLKYFKLFDAYTCADIKKPLEEDIVMAKEPYEGFRFEKHVKVSISRECMIDLSLKKQPPDCEDVEAEALKTEQLLFSTKYHDELRPQEQQALEEVRTIVESQLEAVRSVVESQAQVYKPLCGTSPQHPFHAQSSFPLSPPAQSLPPQETGNLSEICNGKEQFQSDGYDELPRREVPIGSDFQAFVPVWRSSCKTETSEVEPITDGSDSASSRWLGVQVWPLAEAKHTVCGDEVGRGRSDTCDCAHPASVGCIRLHIQEESVKLKNKLGRAYHLWDFQGMGELVAQCWKEEEQKHFKALVKSKEKNFWPNLPFAFPNRVPKDFISYYFNVFILQRRTIQNRLDMCDVDSDDDECSLIDYDEERQELKSDDKGYADSEEHWSDEESWQCITDNEDVGSREQTTSVKHGIASELAGYFTDDMSSTGSIDLIAFPASKQGSFMDFDNLSQLTCWLPYANQHHHVPYASQHHHVRASGTYCNPFGCVPCECACQDGDFWDDIHLEGLNHSLQKETMLVSGNLYELDMISDIDDFEIESEVCSLVKQSSLDICSSNHNMEVPFEPQKV